MISGPEAHRLRNWLEGLSVSLRVIFVLRAVAGLSSQEIAGLLAEHGGEAAKGWTPDAVRAAFRQAICSLASQLIHARRRDLCFDCCRTPTSPRLGRRWRLGPAHPSVTLEMAESQAVRAAARRPNAPVRSTASQALPSASSLRIRFPASAAFAANRPSLRSRLKASTAVCGEYLSREQTNPAPSLSTRAPLSADPNHRHNQFADARPQRLPRRSRTALMHNRRGIRKNLRIRRIRQRQNPLLNLSQQRFGPQQQRPPA